MGRDKQIEAAVNWWAEVIAEPNFDNGDDSHTGVMTAMMARIAADPVSEDQKAIFKSELTRALRNIQDLRGITVDYHPDRVLGEAMTKAGISHSNAPWKTGMYLKENGEVEVKYGYTGDFQTLSIP